MSSDYNPDLIYRLKGDIIHKHGTRGLNICNLCTSGYFENWIKPLYEEMEKSPDFDPEKFNESYNLIIKEAAFAVFVTKDMKPDKLKEIVEKKIARNLKYGVNFINIHGIGKGNVDKIRVLISELETKYPDIGKSIDEKKSIIFSKLVFNQ